MNPKMSTEPKNIYPGELVLEIKNNKQDLEKLDQIHSILGRFYLLYPNRYNTEEDIPIEIFLPLVDSTAARLQAQFQGFSSEKNKIYACYILTKDFIEIIKSKSWNDLGPRARFILSPLPRRNKNVQKIPRQNLFPAFNPHILRGFLPIRPNPPDFEGFPGLKRMDKGYGIVWIIKIRNLRPGRN